MRLWPLFLFNRRSKKNRAERRPAAKNQSPEEGSEEPQKPRTNNQGSPVRSDFTRMLEYFKNGFKDADDFTAREFVIGEPPGTPAALLYIQGLSSKQDQSELILESSMLLSRIAEPPVRGDGDALLNLIEKRYLAFSAVRRSSDLEEADTAILSGESVLLIGGAEQMLLLDTKGWAKRGIDEPATENVIRGPRDGFTETMRVNVSHIRRRLRTNKLAVKELKVGRRTQTDISLIYMTDTADPLVVNQIRNRLLAVKIDGVVDSGQVEQMLTPRPLALFPTVERTERPDKVAASVLEGRIAVVVDNSPFVLIIPVTAWSFFQASEDYYENPWMASLIRMLRILAALLATFSTGAYVAIVTFHQEIVPFNLMLRIVATHEGIPLATLPTAILMELVLEILREAGVRLPRPVGSAISIVGAIIIGDAAVRAGFIPPGLVIVVSLATISSFTIPAYNAAIPLRLARFPVILVSGVLGLFGLVLSGAVLCVHALSLDSFGTPYFDPLGENRLHELRDKPIVVPMPLRQARRPFWSRGDMFRQETAEDTGEKRDKSGEDERS